MASGVPVIAADAASLPEVVGTGGLLLPPDDINGWAEAILHVVDSEKVRSDLIERGLRQAASFSWRRTAEQTVTVYRQALGS
jgi:glycosyltransferase involved in cell wall biosynthesis